MKEQKLLETTAWRDEETDVVYVKLRVKGTDESGRPWKKGIIWKFTDEVLSYIGEGAGYPHKTIPWDSLVEVTTTTQYKNEDKKSEAD